MKSHSLWSLLILLQQVDKMETNKAEHLTKHQAAEINVDLKSERVVRRDDTASSI